MHRTLPAGRSAAQPARGSKLDHYRAPRILDNSQPRSPRTLTTSLDARYILAATHRSSDQVAGTRWAMLDIGPLAEYDTAARRE